MIQTEVHVVGFGVGGITRDVRVIVSSDADGVGFAELRDRNGVPFDPPGGLQPNCSRHLVFEVRGIPVGQFPVFVWAAECANGNPDGQPSPFGPFLPNGAPGESGPPAPPPMCPPPVVGALPSPQCQAALDELARLRNEMRAVCWRIGLRRSDWVGNAAMAAAMALNAAGFYATLVFVLALLATGSILGPFVAIIWGVAGVVALAFLAASVAAAAYATSAARARRELTALESQYETLSEAFRRMAMNVRSTCCAGSYLEQDVALPTCG